MYYCVLTNAQAAISLTVQYCFMTTALFFEIYILHKICRNHSSRQLLTIVILFLVQSIASLNTVWLVALNRSRACDLPDSEAKNHRLQTGIVWEMITLTVSSCCFSLGYWLFASNYWEAAV